MQVTESAQKLPGKHFDPNNRNVAIRDGRGRLIVESAGFLDHLGQGLVVDGRDDVQVGICRLVSTGVVVVSHT